MPRPTPLGLFDYLDAPLSELRDPLQQFQRDVETEISLSGVYINVKKYGAVGNGTTDDIAAIQAAVDAAKTIGSATVYFPKGNYKVTTPIMLFEWKGLRLLGDGRINTQINATNGQPAVQGNGVWYSQFQGLRFSTSATLTNKAVFELDGNYGAGTTQGVQANTFRDCLFEGNGLATYTFALCRQGFSSAQGDHNEFYNCHWSGATNACYYSNGFNALNNIIVGGDIQNYQTYGVYINAGSVQIYGTTFESTYQYTQIINDGYDIAAFASGVSERIIVCGVRTESLRFYKGSSAQIPVLIGNHQQPTYFAWSASTAVTLNTVVVKASPSGVRKLYRVTTAGTTGTSEPTWPASGTVTDGTAVWTLTEFNVVDVGAGSYSDICNFWYVGNIVASELSTAPAPIMIEVTSNYTARFNDEFILVDATAGPVTITLPSTIPQGKRYYIKKFDTSSNAVTVTQSDTGNLDFVAGSSTIPGGSKGFLVVERAGGGSLAGNYWIIARSWSKESDLVLSDNTTNDVSTSKHGFAPKLPTGATKYLDDGSDITIPASKVYKVATNQVVSARKTGWGAPTGTATRSTFASYAGQTISNPPTQAEVQAIDDHVKILSERLKALIDDLTSHGLIGT